MTHPQDIPYGTNYLPESVHEWLEFADPDDPDEFFRIDLTFFLSHYNCIYGRGCPSIKLQKTEDESVGCCSQGASFCSQEDYENVADQVEKLTYADCANLDHVNEHGWFVRAPSGYARNLRKLGNKCIFANPVPTEPGDPPMGCSFHHLADRLGVSFVKTKPETCWKVPMFFDEQLTTSGNTVTIIGAMTRAEWGGSLPQDWDDDSDVARSSYLGWWCMDTPDAYNGDRPYYQTNKEELTEVMGAAAYEYMCKLIAEYSPRKFKMQGELVNSGQPTIATVSSVFAQLRERRAK